MHKKKARLRARLFRGAGKKSLLHHYATLFRCLFELIQISEECRYVVVFELNDNRFPTLFGGHPLDEILFGFFERHGDFWHKTPPVKVDVDCILKAVFGVGNNLFFVGQQRRIQQMSFGRGKQQRQECLFSSGPWGRSERENGVASKHLTFQKRSLPAVNFELVSLNKSEKAIESCSIRFRNVTEPR